jgi:hypothetical protein
MAKRKLDPNLYKVRLPFAKWPRTDQPWSKNDMDTALMINSLSLEPPVKGRTGLLPIKDAKKKYVKVSLLLQALDLANFHDDDIVLDADLEFRMIKSFTTVTVIKSSRRLYPIIEGDCCEQ